MVIMNINGKARTQHGATGSAGTARRRAVLLSQADKDLLVAIFELENPPIYPGDAVTHSIAPT
ncbi:hypothetical protein H351_30010 (plasmid) [Rhodococcus erythropolis R138]|nr:hypothetical protein H351_30010 [Rhodococcus erythropolis R138]